MSYWLRVLEEGAVGVLGRPLAAPERRRFEEYLALLQKWNRVHRLIGRDDPVWIARHIFVDSLLFLRLLPAGAVSVLDLGAGAGVPGIPLRIVRAGLAVTLLESRQRRVSFLSEAVRVLGLTGCTVVGERAEAAVAKLAAAFDAVVIRCAGPADRLMPLARRFLRPGGRVVASGPPRHAAGDDGQWTIVPGAWAGEERRFLVVRSES